MDEHLVQAAEAGANCHIAEPITPERLLAGVAAALSDEPAATPGARGVPGSILAPGA